MTAPFTCPHDPSFRHVIHKNLSPALLQASAEINPLNSKLNPICHLLALLGAHHILHVNGIRVKIGSAFFWDFRQRRMVVSYRRFGTTYRYVIQESGSHVPLKMGPIICPETSVRSYHSTLRKIPKGNRSHVLTAVQI